MTLSIRTKDLSKIGYTDNVARSMIVQAVSKHCKHAGKQDILSALVGVQEDPQAYAGHEIWGPLAAYLCPQEESRSFNCYTLQDNKAGYKSYGSRYIEHAARQQMDLAMRLPVSIRGALMPDAHAGYGLPIGGVLAVDNAVIPYAVGMDIGCRMHLSVFGERPVFLQRYAHQLKKALQEYTHFGMDGGLGFTQEHAVTDRPEFDEISLLRPLRGKAVRQLGTSGGGNHFVEFGEIDLYEGNVLGLPEGSYMALLSHSGSRGLGAEIARYYSNIARDKCRLPREAQHFAWLDMNSGEGQEYWQCMELAGAFAEACHERIHLNLSRAMGIRSIAQVGNHHNFAWRETLDDGQQVIIHRKGATPAHKGTAGIIPGSMTTHGYLVCGKGVPESLFSASHGAGRAMSRQKAKENFTRSALNRMLTTAGVSLIGGSVEEASLAYKDIDRIMSAQSALVDIHGKFMPRIVRMNKE